MLELEREIDRLAYALNELTEEEIEIVEKRVREFCECGE